MSGLREPGNANTVRHPFMRARSWLALTLALARLAPSALPFPLRASRRAPAVFVRIGALWVSSNIFLPAHHDRCISTKDASSFFTLHEHVFGDLYPLPHEPLEMQATNFVPFPGFL